MKKQIKLTKEEKLLSAYLGLRYRVFQVDDLSENAHQIYSYLYSTLYSKSGQLKTEPFQIINGFHVIYEKTKNSVFGVVELDFIENTKVNRYLTSYLVDMSSAFMEFTKEYIEPILTEERFNKLQKLIEEMYDIERAKELAKIEKREQKLQKLKTF